MKQSEKLLWLKRLGTGLTFLGVILVVISAFVPLGVEHDAMWKALLQWGAGMAFSGVAIRIARFLYLWQLLWGPFQGSLSHSTQYTILGIDTSCAQEASQSQLATIAGKPQILLKRVGLVSLPLCQVQYKKNL